MRHAVIALCLAFGSAYSVPCRVPKTSSLQIYLHSPGCSHRESSFRRRSRYPMDTRTRRVDGKPACAVIFRTWRLRPSVRTTSTHEPPGRSIPGAAYGIFRSTLASLSTKSTLTGGRVTTPRMFNPPFRIPCRAFPSGVPRTLAKYRF